MKKKCLFALGGALALHMLYFVVQLLIGIVQTFFYQPQFAPNDVVLQSEVAFGLVAHGKPMIFLISYLVVAALLFMMLHVKESFQLTR